MAKPSGFPAIVREEWGEDRWGSSALSIESGFYLATWTCNEKGSVLRRLMSATLNLRGRFYRHVDVGKVSFNQILQ